MTAEEGPVITELEKIREDYGKLSSELERCREEKRSSEVRIVANGATIQRLKDEVTAMRRLQRLAWALLGSLLLLTAGSLWCVGQLVNFSSAKAVVLVAALICWTTLAAAAVLQLVRTGNRDDY